MQAKAGPSFPISLRRRAMLWALAVAVGLLRIYSHRYAVNPDGLEYIEMGWATVRTGWHGLVNLYWSPLYPFLLSLVFRVFRPAVFTETTYVQTTNFILYLLNLACFEVFLRELVRGRKVAPANNERRTAIPSEKLLTWAYLYFAWMAFPWLFPYLVTPDLCVAGLAYLGMALLLRIRRGSGSWPVYGCLGLTLGLAYLAKEVMFLLAILFLVAALSTERSIRRALPRVAFAAVIFLTISAPLIHALSNEVGRFTFGESGRDNYVWFVNRQTGSYWQGVPPDLGTPSHPTRQLFKNPDVFEFATPIMATFPPGYEPSYWIEGIKPHIAIYSQLVTLYHTANAYLQMFTRTGVMWVTLIVLFIALGKRGKWIGSASRSGAAHWFTWLPAVGALALYSLVHVEPRFIGEFVLMMLVAILAQIELPSGTAHASATRWLAALTMAPALAIAIWGGMDIAALRTKPGYEDFQLARGLINAGVAQGEASGTIGDGPSFYWARLAGLRVVADVPKGIAFWEAQPAVQSSVVEKLVEAGAQIAIAKQPAGSRSTNGWQPISGTAYLARRLKP